MRADKIVEEIEFTIPHHIRVSKNPSRMSHLYRDLNIPAKPSSGHTDGYLRFLVDKKTHDVYVWAARDCIHKDMANKELFVPYDNCLSGYIEFNSGYDNTSNTWEAWSEDSSVDSTCMALINKLVKTQ